MDILPESPTPEALLADRVHGTIDQGPLYATRAIALVRQVARLHKRVLDGNATLRRDRLFVARCLQANALLWPYGLQVRSHATGVDIVELKTASDPAPTVFCEVAP